MWSLRKTREEQRVKRDSFSISSFFFWSFILLFFFFFFWFDYFYLLLPGTVVTVRTIATRCRGTEEKEKENNWNGLWNSANKVERPTTASLNADESLSSSLSVFLSFILSLCVSACVFSHSLLLNSIEENVSEPPIIHRFGLSQPRPGDRRFINGGNGAKRPGPEASDAGLGSLG